MKKPEIIAIKIWTAWKHTAVFLKLVRHKLDNGNLSWSWDSYCFPLIAHYRKTEDALNDKLLVDERWWDRHSEAAKQAQMEKKFTEHSSLFNKYAYDEEIRALIKEIDLMEKQKIFQNVEKKI